MHEIQEKLLKQISQKNIGALTLREMGGLVGEKLPQKIKHHLLQLQKKGFIVIDKHNGVIKRVDDKEKSSNPLISVPILGAANCGPQTIFAEQNVEGYLKISKRILSKKGNIFALRAEGNSMNKADIDGAAIEDGDYVIIDSEYKNPKNNDYVVSVIDGMANIKKYLWDNDNSRILLISESTQDYTPIFIHQNDDFLINGRVIQVIKNPKN